MHLQKFKTTIFPLKSRLYRLARWMTHQQEDAEDIVQEVFLKLWMIRNDLNQYRNIEALAIRMTKNLCLNQLKTRRRSIFTIENQLLAATNAPPDVKAEQQDALDILYQLISQLPAQQRWVVQLRDVEGMEVDEIAQIAEMTPGNVRTTLSLGRKRIRELYRHYDGNEGK